MVEKVRVAVTGRRNGSLSRVRLGVLGLTFKAGTRNLLDPDVVRRAGFSWVGIGRR